MCDNEVLPYIAIDLKKYRIRIHKQAIGLLGVPNYIQILINPSLKLLGIQALDTRTYASHKINLQQLQPDNSYELYSKYLIEKLQSIVPGLDTGCSYRLTGKLDEEKRVIMFSLLTIKKIETGW